MNKGDQLRNCMKEYRKYFVLNWNPLLVYDNFRHKFFVTILAKETLIKTYPYFEVIL